VYLLDTDTCIQLSRANPRLLKSLREHRRSDIRISILSVYELELGLQKSTLQKQKKRKALDDLLELFAVAPFEQREAIEAARIRSELEKAGTPIGSIDYLIAATARANHWTIVTGNVAEFRRVKHLRVETWHA
jgi:tRNA(fMet)-specific endonuclease VapC